LAPAVNYNRNRTLLRDSSGDLVVSQSDFSVLGKGGAVLGNYRGIQLTGMKPKYIKTFLKQNLSEAVEAHPGAFVMNYSEFLSQLSVFS